MQFGASVGGASYEYGRPVEAGVPLEAVVLAAVEGVSKKGNVMLTLTLGVPTTPDYGEGVEGLGAKVDTWVLGNPQHDLTRAFTRAFFAALAPEGLAAYEAGAADLDTASLPGRRCRVVLQMEAFNGQDRPKVAELLPLDGGVRYEGVRDEEVPF